MARALDEFVLDGLKHNLEFLRWLVTHPEFESGNLSTDFLDDHFDPEALAPNPEASEIAVLAAALHAREEHLKVALPEPVVARRSAWKWAERRRGGRVRQ